MSSYMVIGAVGAIGGAVIGMIVCVISMLLKKKDEDESK